MAKATPDRIVLKGDPIQNEGTAGGAITPGHLIQHSGANMVVHATAGGVAARLFAVENAIGGKGIADAYATNEVVQYVAAAPGDEVLALLSDGENASIGSMLESNGDGDLQVAGTVDSATDLAVPGSRVGMALEAVDLSDSSGADPATRRIRVMVQ